MAPAVRALRGATTVDVDTPEHIEERVVALLDTLLERNGVHHDDLISILFTATDDVVSTFPAVSGSSWPPRGPAARRQSGAARRPGRGGDR